MSANPVDVWAPRASSVQLWLGAPAFPDDGRLVPLDRRPGGWWSPPDTAHIAEDADYGFVIDSPAATIGASSTASDAASVDGPPETSSDAPRILTDPRARRQPHGVHRPSRRFDPSRFTWTDGQWTGWRPDGGLIYELHIGTFTPEGTFDAARGKLDHLVRLGIDAIELLPVNAFNGTHNWGYDGVLWFAIHEPYGGPEGYQRFVDACHERGIAVIQDVVYNHLGPSGNVLPAFGPYLREDEANTWGASVNLDGEGSAEVRRFILDNARMWFLDYHADGLRLDAVHALHDASPVHLLAELSAQTEELQAHVGRPLSLIAESDLNDPIMFRPREAGGYGLTAQWSDDFHHAVHVALTGETTGYYADFAAPDALTKVLERGFFHDGTRSSFRGRRHGVPIDTASTETWRLVVASQNHDQIGNRAAGDRLSATLSRGRLAAAAALTILGPFTPMLFMGEEWGTRRPWQFFTSHPEPDLGVRTAEARFAEFARMGWDESAVPDPQDPETFARSHLDWSEAEQDPRGLLGVYQRLIRIRKAHPGLSSEPFSATRVSYDDETRLTVRRGGIALHVNLSDRPWPLPALEGTATLLIAAGDTLDDAGDTLDDRRTANGLSAAQHLRVPGPGIAVLSEARPAS